MFQLFKVFYTLAWKQQASNQAKFQRHVVLLLHLIIRDINQNPSLTVADKIACAASFGTEWKHFHSSCNNVLSLINNVLSVINKPNKYLYVTHF